MMYPRRCNQRTHRREVLDEMQRLFTTAQWDPTAKVNSAPGNRARTGPSPYDCLRYAEREAASAPQRTCGRSQQP